MCSRSLCVFFGGCPSQARLCSAQIQPPQAPPIFNWTDEASGESIVMLLHPRGYGVSVAETLQSGAEPVRGIDGEEEAPAVCTGLQGSRGFGVNDVVQVAGFNEVRFNSISIQF